MKHLPIITPLIFLNARNKEANKVKANGQFSILELAPRFYLFSARHGGKVRQYLGNEMGWRTYWWSLDLTDREELVINQRFVPQLKETK